MKRLTLISIALALAASVATAQIAPTGTATNAVVKGRFVKLSAAGAIQHATAATDAIIGVCTLTQATTNAQTRYAGPGQVVTVTSGELIAVGDLLTGGTLGKAFVLDVDDASTQRWGAIALTAASGADEGVTVVITPGAAEQRLALTGDATVSASLTVGGGYGATGCTISTAGVVQCDGAFTTAGAATADNIVCTNAATFGGGYGATGATISTAGVVQCDGALTTAGAATADNIVCTNAATFGGGYGAAGATISTAGAIQCDGAAEIGGGYGATGCTISDAGVVQCDGAFTTAGAATADSIVCTEGATFGGGYGAAGCTISTAGVVQANGAFTTDAAATAATVVVNDATTPTISLATGMTNTGTITINGNTNGSFVLTTADSTAQAVTLAPAAQTTGAGSVTIPDLAGNARYLPPVADAAGLLDFDETAVAASAAGVTVGLPFMIIFEPDQAETLSYTVPTGRKLRVLDAWAFKTVGAGAHADDDWNLKNNDGTAANIFDAEELNAIADKARIEFDNLDDSERDVAAASSLDLVANENAAGGTDGIIYVLCVWVTP